MKLYFSLILIIIMMAFGTGYYSLFLQRPYIASQDDVLQINRLKYKFQKTVNPMTIVNFSSIYYGKKHFELISPDSIDPVSPKDRAIDYFSSDDCYKGLKSFTNNFIYEKVFIWEEYRCGKRKFLPDGFFKKPPFMHPSGKSYAYLAFRQNKNGRKSKAWVNYHLPFFHVRELGPLATRVGNFSGIFSVLSRLSDSALNDIFHGVGTILTKDYLFAKISYPKVFSIMEYRIYKRDLLDDFLHDTPFVLTSYRKGRSCFYRDGELCWNYNVGHVLTMANRPTIVFFLGLIVVGIIIFIILINKLRSDRIEDERRRLALQVLTHEFRTPIASLLLSVENINRNFGKLDESLESDFLRISAESFRLQRLTEMSRNYLKVQCKDKLIEFSHEKFDSVKEFFENFLCPFFDKYGEENLILNIQEDFSFNFDPYWIGVLVKNLVENAFFHGASPVKLNIYYDIKMDSMVIDIEDQGSLENNDLQKLTREFSKGTKSQGTGLGLNIVGKIINEYKGNFSLKSMPTRFIVKIPNAVDKRGV